MEETKIVEQVLEEEMTGAIEEVTNDAIEEAAKDMVNNGTVKEKVIGGIILGLAGIGVATIGAGAFFGGKKLVKTIKAKKAEKIREDFEVVEEVEEPEEN